MDPKRSKDQQISDNYWYGTECDDDEAQEYCDYWHGDDEDE